MIEVANSMLYALYHKVGNSFPKYPKCVRGEALPCSQRKPHLKPDSQGHHLSTYFPSMSWLSPVTVCAPDGPGVHPWLQTLGAPLGFFPWSHLPTPGPDPTLNQSHSRLTLVLERYLQVFVGSRSPAPSSVPPSSPLLECHPAS